MLSFEGKKLFLFLAFISGFCGISYEIVYFRFLSNIFGEFYLTSISLLVAFIGGIGIGALLSNKLKPYLWIIEGAIGLFGIFLALSYKLLGTYTHPFFLSIINESNLVNFLIIVAILFVPAFLIGNSIPLFSYRLKDLFQKSYDQIYILYNLGAALSILTIEFIVFHFISLSNTLLGLGAINITIAGLLFFIFPITKKSYKRLENLSVFIPHKNNLKLLFGISIASAIFQLLFIQFLYFLFGPSHQNFAIGLSFILLYISIGTFVFYKTKRISHYLKGLILSIFFAITFFNPIFSIVSQFSHSIIAVICFSFIIGIPLFFFGASIPLLIKKSSASGIAIATSSFGNILGYLLFYFIFIPFIPFREQFVILLLYLFVIAIVFLTNKKTVSIVFSSLLIMSIYLWNDEAIFQASHSIYIKNSLNNDIDSIEKYQGKDGVIAKVKFENNTERLFLLGNSNQNLSRPHDILQALITSAYAEQKKDALILGLGAGITARASSEIINTVNVVEISPTIIENIDKFDEENFKLSKQNNVNIIQEDAFIYNQKLQKKYDIIINSIYRPSYNSSSKLYSIEFLELISKNLQTNGVYGTHIVGRLSTPQIKIYLNTLQKVFPYCEGIQLPNNSLVHQLVCSHSPLKKNITEYSFSKEFQEFMSNYHLDNCNIETYTKAFNIFETQEFKDSTEKRYNSLDYPILEYIN